MSVKLLTTFISILNESINPVFFFITHEKIRQGLTLVNLVMKQVKFSHAITIKQILNHHCLFDS